MSGPKKAEPETLTAELVTDPVPGPGARVSRSFGQGGGAVTVVQLWQAFGWLGSGGWTAEQSAQRWPAITATLFLFIATAHNLFNWWRSERRTGLSAVTVQSEAGHVDAIGVLVGGLVLAVVVLLLGRL